MNVVEVSAGKKIGYSVYKNKITFEDEVTLNCEKREQDFDVCIDICVDRDGMLTLGTLGESYAAQVEIPARQYVEREVPNPEYNPDDETSQEKVMEKIPAAFSMANVTLKLYAVE